MKRIKLIYSISIPLILLFCACPFKYPNVPIPLCVYKTKADYFHYLNIGRDKKEYYTYRLGVPMNYEGGDTIIMSRLKLTQGYIVDLPVSVDDYFTDMSWAEFQRYYENDSTQFGMEIPLDTVLKRVIDKDPFTEFWLANSTEGFLDPDYPDTVKINEIIKSGDLEKYFDRLK